MPLIENEFIPTKEQYATLMDCKIMDFAQHITNLIYERNSLLQENKELKERIDQLEKHNQEMFRLSQEGHQNWVQALLNGDLVINTDKQDTEN